MTSAQKELRPGWVWAIAIWHFGGTSLLIAFVILIYSGGVHLTSAQRARWDFVLFHLTSANFVVVLLLLTGTALLFRLRKSAFYMYCGALAGNILILAWLLRMKGTPAAPKLGILLWCFGAQLLLCLYSRYLIRKNVLT